MADRNQASTTDLVTHAPVLPFPSERLEPRPERWDDELDSMAHALEDLVDSHRDPLQRAVDIFGSSMALAVLSPLLLLVAAGIKLDSPGPVFYSQDRIGINRRRDERRTGPRASGGRRKVINAGRPFRIYKFRTMRIDAEAAGPQWAKSQDPRITRLGGLLRKTRLDEVPQFINVLRGDMTLIGPRPERPFFVDILQREVPHYSKRLLVKPGITGLAQVNNGYDESIESVRTKVHWDLTYIRSRGPIAHARIVLKTVRTVLTGEGAC